MKTQDLFKELLEAGSIDQASALEKLCGKHPSQAVINEAFWKLFGEDKLISIMLMKSIYATPKIPEARAQEEYSAACGQFPDELNAIKKHHIKYSMVLSRAETIKGLSDCKPNISDFKMQRAYVSTEIFGNIETRIWWINRIYSVFEQPAWLHSGFTRQAYETLICLGHYSELRQFQQATETKAPDTLVQARYKWHLAQRDFQEFTKLQEASQVQPSKAVMAKLQKLLQ